MTIPSKDNNWTTFESQEAFQNAELNDEDYKLLYNLWTGAEDLFGLGAKKRKRYKTLCKKGLITHSFGLLNPNLFMNGSGELGIWFIFLRAVRGHYFEAKSWLCDRKNQERYSFSAYTTIGKYDFCIRMVGPESDITEIKTHLETFLVPPTKTDTDIGWFPVKVKVCKRYARKGNFGEYVDVQKLDDKKMKFLMDVSREVEEERMANKDDQKMFKHLREEGYFLGTNCCVNTALLCNIRSFIFINCSDEHLEEVLVKRIHEESRLCDSTIDIFEIDRGYDFLLVCEFAGRGWNAMCAYNEWTDRMYFLSQVGACLTLMVDSTIRDFPDILNSSTINRMRAHSLKKEHGRVLLLGKTFPAKEQISDKDTFFSEQSLVKHTMIFGTSGCGKTNALLHIVKQLAEAKVKVVFIGFKSNSFGEMEVKASNGKMIEPKAFLSADTLDKLYHSVSQPLLLQADKNSLNIAEKIFELTDKAMNECGKGQQPLRYFVILDEVFNLSGFHSISKKLLDGLNLYREAGIGLLITAQQWLSENQPFYDACSNRIVMMMAGNSTEIKSWLYRNEDDRSLTDNNFDKLSPGHAYISLSDENELSQPKPAIGAVFPKIKE